MKTDILEKGYITLGRGYEIKQDGNFGEVELIKITDADLSTHVHVLGATGAGKTLLLKLLDTQFLYNGYSLIKLDMKFDEDNFRLVYALSHYLNKPFYFLNLAAATGSNSGLSGYGTHSYNPLETGDELSITAKIMQATKEKGLFLTMKRLKKQLLKPSFLHF